MIIINKDEFPAEIKPVEVEISRCDGCALCVEVCSKTAFTSPARPSQSGYGKHKH